MKIFTTAIALLACFGFTGCGGGSSSRGASGSASSGATTAGVTSGGSLFGGSSSGSSGTAPPPAGNWYRGDLHSHSDPYSNSALEVPGTVFYLANVAGLDFIALTDHRTFDHVSDPTYNNQYGVTALGGEEWGGAVHAGMQGLTSLVPEIDSSLGASTINSQVQRAFDEAHRQGAVITANHPARRKKINIWQTTSYDAVEVWNVYWSFPNFVDANPSDVDDRLASRGLTAIGEDASPEIREAVAHRGIGMNHQGLKFYEAHLNRGRHKAAVGGSDFHGVILPGVPTTYVYAEDSSHDKIIAGIKAARTWVGAADGPVIDFRADADGDGVYESIIGDSVPLNRPVSYRVRVQNAARGRVDVVKNSTTILQFACQTNDETFTWTDASTSQSWIRLNVLEYLDWNVPNSASVQLLALTGSYYGAPGLTGLQSFALPYGFQLSLGTRYPLIKLPHALDKILNFDRTNWGYSMGAITSPIWAE